jgi:hypothetical protein
MPDAMRLITLRLAVRQSCDGRTRQPCSTEVPPEQSYPAAGAGLRQVHHRYNSRYPPAKPGGSDPPPTGRAAGGQRGAQEHAHHGQHATKSQSKRSGEPLLLPRFRPLYVRNQRGAATTGD